MCSSGNNLFGGTYDIAIEGPEDCVQVTALASFMGTTHTTIVEASVDKLPVNHPPGALYLSTEVVTQLKLINLHSKKFIYRRQKPLNDGNLFCR